MLEKGKYNSNVLSLINDAVERKGTAENNKSWLKILSEFARRSDQEPDIIMEYFYFNTDCKDYLIGVCVYDYGEYNGLGPNSVYSRRVKKEDIWLKKPLFDNDTDGSHYRLISRNDWLLEDSEEREGKLLPSKINDEM